MQGRAMAWRATCLHGLEQASVHRRALAWRATHQVGELKWLVGQECIGALGHGRERTCLAVQGRQGIVWLWEQCFSSRCNGSHRRRSSTSASYILHLDLEWGGRWGVVRSWGGRDALCAACTGGMGRVMAA